MSWWAAVAWFPRPVHRVAAELAARPALDLDDVEGVGAQNDHVDLQQVASRGVDELLQCSGVQRVPVRELLQDVLDGLPLVWMRAVATALDP